jgi:Na+-transporting NADH:ubiquinone oxidoreductase subunit A
MIRIKKGLDLPIAGVPADTIEPAKPVTTVALLGTDYVGMKPTMAVREGDAVKRGQLLFTDKKNDAARFTSPAAGRVRAIHRGAKRALVSVVIDVDGDDAESIPGASRDAVTSASRPQIVESLVTSGLWTAFRTRPFSRTPAADDAPHSIFVTAIDTNPVAGNPLTVIAAQRDSFALGLDVVARLTEGKVYLCTAPGADVPTGRSDRVTVETFEGPHPAGLAGTHVHFLDPVSASKTVWTIGYQDVIAFGRLFETGQLRAERVVALGGPGAARPRLLRTVLGASTDDLTAGELAPGEQRVISGSVLSGRSARGAEAYLGRFHDQVSVLPEDYERRMFGYLTPGGDRHSVFPIYLSYWLRPKTTRFTTSTNGGTRGMVPIGTYERVMPLDILPTQLLRSLLVGDIEMAINLGCLELDEEDLALCTYACPAKYEYGPVLRSLLNVIQKEG